MYIKKKIIQGGARMLCGGQKNCLYKKITFFGTYHYLKILTKLITKAKPKTFGHFEKSVTNISHIKRSV